MAFFKKDRDKNVAFYFVCAWVSNRSSVGNLESHNVICMDVSCALGGVHNAPTDSDHRNEGDDDKVALISKVCMVNSEVCHGMVSSASALRIEKASVYQKRVGASRRWRRGILKAKLQM